MSLSSDVEQDLSSDEEQSLLSHEEQEVQTTTYTSINNPKDLVNYLNQKRHEGKFNDVKIQAGNQIFPANRMLLSCHSKYFEGMFQLPLKELHQDMIEIRDFDEEAIKMLIDFIYERKIDITNENVWKLLPASHYLQLKEVTEFCFNFLEKTVLDVNNCLEIVLAYDLYQPISTLDRVYFFIGDNLDEIVQTEHFKSLSKAKLIAIITSLVNAEQTSVYNAVKQWVKHDVERRRADFSSLLMSINLYQLPRKFLEETVATDELVKENLDCVNVLFLQMIKNNKDSAMEGRGSRILLLGGGGRKVTELMSVSGASQTVYYPNLPVIISGHCAVNLHNVVYCIGGRDDDQEQSTKNVYRLDLNKETLKWEKVCAVSHVRKSFAASVFKNSVVVCEDSEPLGQTQIIKQTGFSFGTVKQTQIIKQTGFSFGGVKTHEISRPISLTGRGNSTSTLLSDIATPGDSLEFCKLSFTEWKRVSNAHCSQFHEHALVTCNDFLYALNRSNGKIKRLSELDGKWEDVASTIDSRSDFAAVSYKGYIYVIGGIKPSECFCGEADLDGSTRNVQKFDPLENSWSNVTKMNYERSGHSACVLRDRIIVVGGKNRRNDLVTSVECYDPVFNTWSIIPGVTLSALKPAIVVV